MNVYSKFVPNVFLAKCKEQHEKGSTILVETRHGKENESIVFNLIYEKDGYYYYSIVRADGFNVQEWAKRKAERLQGFASTAEHESMERFKASNEDRAFLSLAEPIKIGHHSEKRHRAVIEKAQNNMQKSYEASKKAEEYERRAEYWKNKENVINLSMPESIDFYEHEVERTKNIHTFYKENPDKREHSFSLAYANKDYKEAVKKYELAKRLWG